MKNTLLAFFVFASFLAFGQQKLTPEQSAQAWAQIEPFVKTADRGTTGGMPPISGSALVNVRQTNEHGERITLTYSLPGTYLLQGVTCEGEPVKLGGFKYDGPVMFMPALVLDTDKRFDSAPYTPNICFVNIFRLNGGSVEQLTTALGRHTTFYPQVMAEAVDGSGYQLVLSGVPIDGTITIGTQAISLRKEQLPNGMVRVFFPAGSYIPPAGPTTLTICHQSSCETSVIIRRIQPPIPKG